MDNNFSKILDIFKRLDETFNRDDIVIDGKQVNLNTIQIDGIDTNDYPDFVDAYIGNASFVDGTPLSDDQCLALSQNYPQVVSDNIQDQLIDAGDAMHDAYKHGDFSEDSMVSAKKHSTGPEFTGYWKGTDKRTPGKHMVGAAEGAEQECEQPVSLSDKLKARWEETKRAKGLQEYGAPNTASAGGNTMAGLAGATTPQDQQKIAKQMQNTQTNLNKLKSVGLPLATGVSQAAQTAVKTVNNPAAIPTQQDKKIGLGLGGELEQMIAKADPGQISQVANVLKKIKQGDR
jgi:hypothetical protein